MLVCLWQEGKCWVLGVRARFLCATRLIEIAGTVKPAASLEKLAARCSTAVGCLTHGLGMSFCRLDYVRRAYGSRDVMSGLYVTAATNTQQMAKFKHTSLQSEGVS